VVRSPAVREVRLHALGPAGTNIAQACEHFIVREGIADKTTLIVHDRKIEPREYAAIARSEVRPGVLPLHVECAVYYGLRDLYDERPDEVIFASQLYMPLDTMQLACRDLRGLDARRGSLVIASHPSPLGLVKPLFAAGVVVHRHASSNADAAAMVRLGDADLCITTEAAGRRHGLHTLHRFGSPTMLFTIAASVTDRVLRDYLLADPEENHACPVSASTSPRNASRTASPSRSWL
jgi:hypothetical protein